MHCYQIDWVYVDEFDEPERRSLVDANSREDAVYFLRKEIATGELVKVVRVEEID